MEIKTIDDWFDVERELQRQIRSIGYNPDLFKMKRNLDAMITDLSRASVEARRGSNYGQIESKLNEINRSIQSIEHWILMLVLER
jgi:hypothetical protein